MKLYKSFVFALKGLYQAGRGQVNLKIHVVAAVVVTGIGFYFGITPLEWCVIILAIALVIAAELINTAIENLTDLVTKEQNPLAGKVKDIAAVLVTAIAALAVGIIIFGKYFF